MLKKALHIFLIIMMATTIFFPIVANADDNRTLQDLIDELNQLKAELKEVNEEQKLTEQEINQIRANIARINRELMEIDLEIENLIAEIEQLNQDIKDKDAEMKRIINQYQLLDGSNAYVEYVMGAATVTDFIFRLSIVEQMSEHNQNLIDTMNDLIEKAEAKNVELEDAKKVAKRTRSNLYDEQFKLGNRVQELGEHEMTLEDEIADAIETIDNYKRYFNCQPHQRLKDCTQFPVDSSFVRPTSRGVVTSEFGWRTIFGRSNFHAGMDIAHSTGEPIYTVANGVVVFVRSLNVSSLRNQISGHCYNDYRRLGRSWPSACVCGGQMLIVQHNVNGQAYASRYIHMNQIHVGVGDQVARNTQIGTMGGTEFYDHCSTGAHLHFEIAEGVYGQDFTSFSRTGPIINPRNKLSFPNRGVWFSGRF